MKSNTRMSIMKKVAWSGLFLLLLAACQSLSKTAPTNTQIKPPTPAQTFEISIKPTLIPTGTSAALFTSTPLPTVLSLDPKDWEHWSVLPIVPEHARQIYLLGQSLGTDPHAFSVFADCNSLPEDYLGIYETDPQAVTSLPPNLQETVTWFKGSFNRASPTVRAGTTTGALLWTLWHQNMYTCTANETPLQCELRIHRPAFVIIQVGSHYEARNKYYMQLILDQLLAAGVVPILATKADDIEVNGQLNGEYAELAIRYTIPFWNFWAAVDGLPNRGLYSRPEDTYQGGLYLTDEAIAIHRLTALQSLDVVRRAVMEP